MKEELDLAISKLGNALKGLREGSEKAVDELGEDGVIQRFEFTFELFWKALKMFLQDKGIAVKAPGDVLKEAFNLEWLDAEDVFLNMLEDRNKTSHIYDRKTSREVFERIRENYVEAMARVLEKLKTIT